MQEHLESAEHVVIQGKLVPEVDLVVMEEMVQKESKEKWVGLVCRVHQEIKEKKEIQDQMDQKGTLDRR